MVKEDNIRNEDISKSLPKSKLYLSCKDNYNISTYSDFLAYVSLLTTDVISSSYKTGKKRNKSLPEVCEEIINAVSVNIFKPLNIYEEIVTNYNKQFNIFGKDENPFKITEEQLLNYINSNTREKTKSASRYANDFHDNITPVEQYLKTMFLCNRLTKIGYAFIDCDVENYVFTKKNENNLNYKDKQNLIESYKRKYNKLYNKYCRNGTAELKDLTQYYKKYYKNEISRTELERTIEYQNILGDMDNITNSHKDIGITLDTFFRYCSYKRLIEHSYIIKGKMKNKSLEYWFNTIKKIQEDNNLSEKQKEMKISQFKSKFRITKYKDRNIDDNEIKNSSAEPEYNTVLNFFYQGYNVPFSVHIDCNELEEIMKEYGVQIEDGEIDMKHFDDGKKGEIIDTRETFLFKPIIPYKYTEHQLIQIRDLYTNFNEYEKNYFLKKSLLEYMHSMTSNLNRLCGPKLSTEHSIEEEYII